MTRPPDLFDDVALYDLLHGGYRDDVAFYRSLALDHAGRVLEIGAGTGRLTREFARLASEVVALEPSSAMRSALVDALATQGWEGAPRVDVRGETIEAYASQARGSFDLVVAPFNVLLEAMTIDAQDAFLAAAFRSTAPAGLFALDVMAPPRGVLDGVPREEFRESHVDGADTIVTRVQWHDAARQVLRNTFDVETLRGDGRVSRRHVAYVVRYLHRFELERAVRQAGFTRVRVYEDFDRSPVRTRPLRFVVMARP